MPIYLRITVESKRAEFTTGRECEPSRWNAVGGRVTGAKEAVKSVNAYLGNEFASDRLAQVRDTFLLGCFTGLAYSDIQKLEKGQITRGIDGEQWIFSQWRKTNVKSHIPLLPKALQIIDRYKDHPLCESNGIVLPVPSNQKMNDYLKEIAVVCGINKILTSHVARHTFATTVTLQNGVPIESVSKML